MLRIETTTFTLCAAVVISLSLIRHLLAVNADQFPTAFVSKAHDVAHAQMSFRRNPSIRIDPFHSIYYHAFRYRHAKQGRHSRHILSSTTSKRSDDAKTRQGSIDSRKYNVVYQKVLRAPNQAQSNTFLLDLVTYLQTMVDLPDGLPMPYNTKIPDDCSDEEDSSNNRAILIIDSPLADDPYQARLEVEVIGIFPEQDRKDEQTFTAARTLAMVALKKIDSPKRAGNDITEGLFSASERLIIQSIDRGLQDFEEGRLVIPSQLNYDETDVRVDEFNDLDDDGIDAAIKRMGYRNSIKNAATEADVIQNVKNSNYNQLVNAPNEPSAIVRDNGGNIVIDAQDSSPRKTAYSEPNNESQIFERQVKEQDEAVSNLEKDGMNSVVKPTKEKLESLENRVTGLGASNSAGSLSKNSNEDYAIEMARKQADALMITAKVGISTSRNERTVNISGGEGEFAIQAAKRAAGLQNESAASTASTGQARQQNDSPLSAVDPRKPGSGKEKRMPQNLSSDEMFVKLQSEAIRAKRKSWNKTISKKGSQKSTPETDGIEDDREQEVTSSTINEFASPKSDDEIRNDVAKVAKESQQVQDLLKSATDMIPNDEDLSPEELLTRVLKFGDEKEREDSPGVGFVVGAMEKAKNLLKSEQIVDARDKGFAYKEYDDGEIKRRAEEEELRKIFAAGQTTANNKLSAPVSRSSGNIRKQSITEEDIQALIDGDETISRNARILDDELAELEIRISRSLEDSGGTSKNNLFDIFSGPEVYNPNVDPATAVNWPGAKDGTRTDVHLATELETALKQAKFAAAVLTRMREEESDNGVRYYVGEKEIAADRVNILRSCVNEATRAGIIENPQIILLERSRLQILINELKSQPEERFEEIALNYKDLLLSDNFVDLIRERLQAMVQLDLAAKRGEREDKSGVHAGERAIMINLAQLAQGLVKEAQALGAELEVSMLEIIRSICDVAMDPSHKNEQETAMALTDAVRDMRPLLDDAFVAYLKFAIAEEEASLERSGVVDDPEHNRWLFVLKIVQEGVYAELSRGVKRYIDHISYVLRMKTKSERKDLLKKLIDVMPTMDVRPFVKVVGNIVSSLGTSAKGDFAEGVLLGEMTNKLLQLQRDVDDLLPPDRINELSRDSDMWAATQRQRLLERQKLTRQRLKAARQTGSIDPDKVINEFKGEYERFD